MARRGPVELWFWLAWHYPDVMPAPPELSEVDVPAWWQAIAEVFPDGRP